MPEGFQFTGLPGPGDVARALGSDVTEQQEQQWQQEMDLTTGTPPLVTGAGGTTSLVSTLNSTSILQAGGGVLGFLGTRRQPTGNTGSPTELVDDGVEFTTETGASGVNALTGDGNGAGAAGRWARLLEWLATHPRIVVGFLALVLLAPVLGPAAETAANVTED